MEEKGLSPGMLLHQAWALFKKNWLFLITVFLVGYAVILIPSFLQIWYNKPGAFMQGVFAILGILFSLFVTIGWIKVTLKLVKGEKRSFSDLFKGFPLILNLLVADVLIVLSLIIIPTLIFLFFALPGIFIVSTQEGEIAQWGAHHPFLMIIAAISFLAGIVAAAFSFYYLFLSLILTPYFIVDCYEGPVEAMRMSYRASKGVKWDLFSIVFITIILFILGFLSFVLGVLVAAPLLYLVYALAYRELVETTRWQGIVN